LLNTDEPFVCVAPHDNGRIITEYDGDERHQGIAWVGKRRRGKIGFSWLFASILLFTSHFFHALVGVDIHRKGLAPRSQANPVSKGKIARLWNFVGLAFHNTFVYFDVAYNKRILVLILYEQHPHVIRHRPRGDVEVRCTRGFVCGFPTKDISP
jgi:hypothetical protein